MDGLAELIGSSEDWLVARVLHHAKERGYTRYTSTLMEAWRASIVGLSGAIVTALALRRDPPELDPDEDYASDPITAFGIREAQQHRSRGITLGMFLGLMKYYRQAYVDLVEDADVGVEQRARWRLFLDRCFDRIEIGFCVEWGAQSTAERLDELQTANRQATNEKNRYLTIFESIGAPIVLLDENHEIVNMNHSAATLFAGRGVPGSAYYGSAAADDGLAWLREQSRLLDGQRDARQQIERSIETSSGLRVYNVQLQPMLDVSEKFQGTVAVFDDLTERKRLEEELRAQSIRDELTGLYNRRGFLALARDRLRLARRTRQPHWLFFADLNGMKAINDRLGHHQGDRALVDVAWALAASFRQSDIVSRFGGDEFVVLAGGGKTGITRETVLERLEERIAQRTDTDPRPYELSLSVGVVSLDPTSDLTLEESLSRADAAMYTHKTGHAWQVVGTRARSE